MGRRALRACRVAFWLVLLSAVSAWAQPRPATGVHVAAPLVAPPVGGLNCGDATTRCVPSEYATIDACWEAANAGDTCLVSAGTYAEVPTSTRNGTSGNTITFVASGTVTMCGWTFTSNSYIRVIGFTITRSPCGGANNLVQFNTTNSFLEFWNNEFTGTQGSAFAPNATPTNNFIVFGNEFHHIAETSGNQEMIVLEGDNNFVAYNSIHDIAYLAVNITGGSDNRFYNQYMYNIHAAGGPNHPDCYFFGNAPGFPFNRNLFESSFCIGLPTNGDSKWIQYSNAQVGASNSSYTVVRREVAHNHGSGYGANQANTANISWMSLYQNTEVEGIRFTGSTTGYNFLANDNGAAQIDHSYFHNNLLWEAWAESITTNVRGFFFQGTPGNESFDYNLGYDPDGSVTFVAPWTDQAHPRTNVNPLLTNVAADDFTLSSSSSAAFGTAGPLTTTSGSGTGTTFNVQTGFGRIFFGDNTSISQYGGNLVVGDVLCVGTDIVQVSSIATDAITVTSSFTWANGDPVYFGDDCSPDIGAFPYKAGGYTITATYVNSGGTVTTTPNDISLVRFVICYSDGVPYAVDNASPYTCPSPSGTLAVRVYPLYANTPRWVVATP